MATEPVQSKKGLESEPPVSQDNKHSESEKNGKKINDLIDSIYAFMQRRCPDRKISESIAMTLSEQGIELENMTKRMCFIYISIASVRDVFLASLFLFFFVLLCFLLHFWVEIMDMIIMDWLNLSY